MLACFSSEALRCPEDEASLVAFGEHPQHTAPTIATAANITAHAMKRFFTLDSSTFIPFSFLKSPIAGSATQRFPPHAQPLCALPRTLEIVWFGRFWRIGNSCPMFFGA